ncbi:MAG: hypothetical protein Fur0037_19260 [Planctomycetota bacterium]
MNPAPKTPPIAAALLLAASISAQAPDNPPPWWGQADNDTVSIYWSFDNPAAPLQPTFAVVPSWFSYPSGTTFGFVNSPNITHLANLGGHAGAIGFTGSGAGQVHLDIDNDPRPTWVKLYHMQFDSYATATGSVVGKIREELSQYKRANMAEQTVSIGQGWNRTTITAMLIPQPDWEGTLFDLNETASGSVAIDELYVDSYCIKPPPDEDGDAMGDVDASTSFDLLAATANANCEAAVAFVHATGTIEYWVAGLARSPNGPHEFYRLTSNGTNVQTVLAPTTAANAPLGFTDLTVAELPQGTFVYGISDERPAGPVRLTAIDPLTGAIQPPPLSFTLQYPAGTAQRHGLAFYPNGALGAGTFLVSDMLGALLEFDRAGNLIGAARQVPTGVRGIGYDRLTASIYLFSSTPLPTAGSPGLVVGHEYSARDFQPTGVRFFGDLTLPNPGGVPGGTAAGFHVYRRLNGEFRALCVAKTAQGSQLYELKGPFRYGWSLLGTMGMSGGPPYRGNSQFRIELDGVPHAAFATLYFGFDNRTYLGRALPFAFTSPPLPPALNMPETILSISLDSIVATVPIRQGSASVPVPIPNLASFAYVPTFWQWLVFDPTVPNGFTLSQAGKTVIY